MLELVKICDKNVDEAEAENHEVVDKWALVSVKKFWVINFKHRIAHQAYL